MYNLVKLNLKEIDDLDSISYDRIINYDLCTIPLFHGTRRYMIEGNEEELRKFLASAKDIIIFAKELLNKHLISDEQLSEYRKSKKIDEYGNVFLNKVILPNMFNLSNYDYGQFYVTTGFVKAISFSSYIGGEIGRFAYNQCIGIVDFKINVSIELREKIKFFIDVYNKIKNTERIVIIYNNISYKNLLTTSKHSPILEQLYKCYENDNCDCSEDLILDNVANYLGFVVSEHNFRKAINKFTEVSNIDECFLISLYKLKI